jgi:hypothetical protein
MVTNWERLLARAGKNESFPGRRVYLFGSLRRLEATPEWLKQFRSEAEAHNLEVSTTDGYLYVLMKEGE